MRLKTPLPFILLAGMALAFLAPRPSEAQPERALRLRYVRGSGTAHCPAETGLRKAVATHLGYDPFTADAPNELSIALAHAGQEIRATLVLRDMAGETLGTRELASKPEACADLIATVGLTISMIVDRVQFPPDAAPVPPRRSTAPPARLARPAQGDRGAERIQGRGGISTGVAVSDARAAGVALAAQIGVQKGWLSAAIEVGTELPVVRLDDDLRQDAYLFAGSVIPCVRPRIVFVCAVVSGGALVVNGTGLDGPRTDRSTLFRFGARAGAELRLTPVVSLEAYGDAMAPWAPWALGLRRPAIPRVSGVIGAGVAARF